MSGLLLFFFTLAVAIFAWITYGTLQGVFGALAYLIVGLLNLWPWIVPFAGFILGIMDLMTFFGPGMYAETLSLAHLTHSWMPALWYLLVSLVAMLINLIEMLTIISWLKGLKYRKREPKSNLALVNCNIVDGDKNSKIVENGVILIKNLVEEGETPGLIVGVGTASKVKVPDNYKKVDLNGYYVLPGLINAHCHVTGSGKPMKLMNLSDDMLKTGLKLLNNPLGKRLLFKLMKKNALTALNAGVTTLKTMGDPFYMDVKLRKKIEKGKFMGPRLVVAGMGISPTGGHGGAIGNTADSTQEIRKHIRQNLRNEVDFIKILSTGGVMDSRVVGEAGRPQMTVEEIETACFEAHRGGVMVATHCESTDGIREALEGGVDTIEHGAEISDDLVPLFKNNLKSLRGYTAYSTTLSAGMGLATLPIKVTKLTEVKFENAKLVEIGMIKGLQRSYEESIKLALGTDASVPYSTHYQVWKELMYWVKYTGMTPQEAIYHATKGNAEIMGIDDETGSIEIGKSADLQVVPENPLENLNSLGNVIKVVIRGTMLNNPKVKKIKKLKDITPIEL